MDMFDIDAMKKELHKLDGKRNALAHLIGAAESYAASEASAAAAAKPPAARPPKTVKKITEDVALELISVTGSPVSTRQVIDIMRDRKLPLPSKNVINVISARLSNSTKLKGRRGIGWWPTQKNWPDEETEMFRPEAPPQNENGEAEASPDTGEVTASPNESSERERADC